MIRAISGLKNKEYVIDINQGMKCHLKANCRNLLNLLGGIVKGRSKKKLATYQIN